MRNFPFQYILLRMNTSEQDITELAKFPNSRLHEEKVPDIFTEANLTFDNWLARTTCQTTNSFSSDLL